MSSSVGKAINKAESVKRHRLLTACTTCRDRRVKCDRVHPVCSQCKKGRRICAYVRNEQTKFRFVDGVSTEHSKSREDARQPPESWASIFVGQQQSETTSGAENHIDKGRPIWTLAELEEHILTPGLLLRELPLSECVLRLEGVSEAFVGSLLLNLPDLKVCQIFLERYIQIAHPFLPICHIPTLRQQFCDFWMNLSNQTPAESTVLILAVLHAGANMSTNDAERQYAGPILYLYEQIFHIIDFASFCPTASALQLLQGFLIMNTISASQKPPFVAYGFVAPAIRFAQVLRLHVDPKIDNVVEAEVRRRLWWHLIYLDAESTIASGLDGIIRIDRYTTQLPCLLSDVAIIEGELGKSNEEQAYHISPMMVAARGRWLWAQCIQKWHNKSPAPGDYPEFSQSIQNLRSSLSDRSDSEWVGVYLEMQIDRAYCMLGLSVWRLERFRQTGCQDKIIETARAFLLKYTQLHEALRTKEQEWFLAGIVQPLHALVILAIHLTNCAHLEEEKRSTYSLLKHVIAIRSKTMSSGNTVSGEPSTKSYLNPRHRALLYLLRRVCRKIGWSLLPKDNFANAPTPPSRDDDGLQGLQIPKHVETSLPEALLRTTDDYEVASVQVTVPMIEDALGCDYATALHWDDWDALSAQFFPV